MATTAHLRLRVLTACANLAELRKVLRGLQGRYRQRLLVLEKKSSELPETVASYERERLKKLMEEMEYIASTIESGCKQLCTGELTSILDITKCLSAVEKIKDRILFSPESRPPAQVRVEVLSLYEFLKSLYDEYYSSWGSTA